MVKLRVDQDGTTHVRAYNDEIISIGKAPSNLLVLKDDEVSRKHATIERRGEGWVLIDKSTNGTVVADRKIEPNVPVRLEPGVKIAIGPFLIYFDPDDSADPSGEATMIRPRKGTSTPTIDLALDLRRAYARAHVAAPPERTKVLQGVLAEARKTLGDRRLIQELEKIEKASAATAAPAAAELSSPTVQSVEEFYIAAHTALASLSRALIGKKEQFSAASEIERFAKLLERFVLETADWVVRSAQSRQNVRESFAADTTSFLQERGPLESATEAQQVIAYLLDWSDHNKRPDDVGPELKTLYQSFLAQHLNVVKGARAACAELLRRVDPKTIEKQARTEAGWGVASKVDKAVASPLWRKLQQVWEALADPGRLESEIVSPQMKQALQSTDPGKTIVEDKE